MRLQKTVFMARELLDDFQKRVFDEKYKDAFLGTAAA